MAPINQPSAVYEVPDAVLPTTSPQNSGSSTPMMDKPSPQRAAMLGLSIALVLEPSNRATLPGQTEASSDPQFLSLRSADPLCAARASVFSGSTMKAGSSVDAVKCWSANSKSFTFFSTMRPRVRP